MYVYLASSPAFRSLGLGKIGSSKELYGRRSTYLTGCPPGLTPSHDIDYEAVWETTATTSNELLALEDEVHHHFQRHRRMRHLPGDSEWFQFQGDHTAITAVGAFIESRPWFKRTVPLSEITPPKRTHRYLRTPYHKNLSYLKIQTQRNATLDALQQPVIAAIQQFMADPDTQAGYVIAPCGSGKTRMTAKGIHGVRRCIIGCPSHAIQQQWRTTLLAEGVFSEQQIYIIGSTGTTDPSPIQAYLKKDTFCLLTTYASSHLLVDPIDDGLDLLVLDEAHHMAGIVAQEDTGVGRTRRLMRKASDRSIKRLSLTYTPRFINADADAEAKEDADYLTMDDAGIFGGCIAELRIRDLIRKGVLPDYRLWTLRDEAKKGTGIIGKAECLLEAWNATEMVRTLTEHDEVIRAEKPILHHLIVFASTTQEAKDLEHFFRGKTTDTLVLRVKEGDALEAPLAQFTAAPRAILVNCFVLNEGVDIPIANAVAIMYPKQSRGQITQMVLRAGRWYEGKSIFHLLLPTVEDEDLSGFEEVLCALASCDEQIRDEILLRSAASKVSDPLPPCPTTGDTVPECIVMEEFEANVEEVKRCFAAIRKNLFPAKERRRIQQLCMERGIHTSVEYALLRMDVPELPEDPRPKGEPWYDYLHPDQKIRYDMVHTPYRRERITFRERISGRDFVERVFERYHLRTGHAYDKWLTTQPPETIVDFPSVQNINDGFFDGITNFNTLLERYGKKPSKRR